MNLGNINRTDGNAKKMEKEKGTERVGKTNEMRWEEGKKEEKWGEY